MSSAYHGPCSTILASAASRDVEQCVRLATSESSKQSPTDTRHACVTRIQIAISAILREADKGTSGCRICNPRASNSQPAGVKVVARGCRICNPRVSKLIISVYFNTNQSEINYFFIFQYELKGNSLFLHIVIRIDEEVIISVYFNTN